MQKGTMPQPAYYMFVCSVERPPHFPKPSCVNDETRDLFGHLTTQLMQKGIMNTVMPIQTGCLGRCGAGAVMLVEPGHYMYSKLTKEKIDKIIEEHIIEGNVVKEYLIDENIWGEAISPKDMQKMTGIS